MPCTICCPCLQLTERKERNGYYRREHSSDGEQEAENGKAYHAGSKRQRSSEAAAADSKGAEVLYNQQNGKQHGVGEGHPTDPAVEGAQQPVGEDDLQ